MLLHFENLKDVTTSVESTDVVAQMLLDTNEVLNVVRQMLLYFIVFIDVVGQLLYLIIFTDVVRQMLLSMAKLMFLP